MTIATIRTEDYHGFKHCERVRLPAVAEYEDSNSHYREQWTGVKITGIWTGPRSGRRFGRTHSIWLNDKTHAAYGTEYVELSESDYLDWCHQVGIEPQITPNDV